jgi:caffeoyl-CoA O-methyltransferase
MSDKSELIAEYVEKHSTAEDRLLAQINRETHLRVLNPRMLSGPLQGKLLEFISRMIKPDFILEIGTFTGYSAICLARGLADGGKLYTIEKNDELIHFPISFFEKAGLSDKIELLNGNALEIIPALNIPFDLVYIDAEKSEYIHYYELVMEKLKKGGFIIADNVLWDGKVIEKPGNTDIETQSIIAFNELIHNDSRVENIMLPLRDGISLIRKL